MLQTELVASYVRRRRPILIKHVASTPSGRLRRNIRLRHCSRLDNRNNRDQYINNVSSCAEFNQKGNYC